MKKSLLWISFLCVFLLAACTDDEGNTKNNTTETNSTETTGDIKEDTTSKEKEDTSTNTKSSEIFDLLYESGLVRGEKAIINESSHSEQYDRLKVHGVVSSTMAQVDERISLVVLEFPTEADASNFSTYDEGVLYKNIFIALKSNLQQKESYLRVLEAGKPIRDLERVFISEEQKQLNQALKENDLKAMTTILSAIKDWKDKDKVFNEEIYLAKVKFETVFVGEYDGTNTSHIFTINSDSYIGGYNNNNFILDGNYVFIDSDSIKEELEVGKKYVVEGYIEQFGTFHDPDINPNNEKGGGAWDLILMDIK